MSAREAKELRDLLLSLKAEMDEVKESVQHPHELPPRSPDKIELPDMNGKMQLYLVKNIIMIEGAKQYINVHFVNGHVPQKLTPSHSLGYWEKTFCDIGFLKLHRSHMVNPKHILGFDSNSYFLNLTDEHHFTVQKPYRKKLHYYFHRGGQP